MNTWMFAFRNLGRNRRRSMVIILSVSLGFAAVALFAGYTKMVYMGLEFKAIYGEMIGHLTIEKENFAKEGRLSPDKSLLTAQEIDTISKQVRLTVPDAYIAPRLGINGLLSNGQVSTIFIAEGIDPLDMDVLRGPLSTSSGLLDKDTPNGAVLADGLADVLSLKRTGDASAMVSTIHGQANASDLVVTDLFATGNAGTKDKLMYMPLSLARTLFDAPERADRLTVLTPSTESVNLLRNDLQSRLRAAGVPVKVSTWEELSVFYRQVKGMFDMIFGFLLAIVVTVLVMSIANAMSMNVVERTREIGTLRAIGLRRWGIVRIFVVEAFVLVVVGCTFGLLIALLTRYGVNAMDISYIPPNSTNRVPLLIGIDVSRSLFAAVALSVLAVLASFLPAWRAARTSIIDSLAHT